MVFFTIFSTLLAHAAQRIPMTGYNFLCNLAHISFSFFLSIIQRTNLGKSSCNSVAKRQIYFRFLDGHFTKLFYICGES